MIECNLKEILEEKELSQRKIVKNTGISFYTLRKLLKNDWKGVNRETINTLCKELRITPGDLFKFTPDNENLFSVSQDSRGERNL